MLGLSCHIREKYGKTLQPCECPPQPGREEGLWQSAQRLLHVGRRRCTVQPTMAGRWRQRELHMRAATRSQRKRHDCVVGSARARGELTHTTTRNNTRETYDEAPPPCRSSRRTSAACTWMSAAMDRSCRRARHGLAGTPGTRWASTHSVTPASAWHCHTTVACSILRSASATRCQNTSPGEVVSVRRQRGVGTEAYGCVERTSAAITGGCVPTTTFSTATRDANGGGGSSATHDSTQRWIERATRGARSPHHYNHPPTHRRWW